MVLHTAFQKLESNSTLKFIEQTDEKPFIFFTPNGDGCHSQIGRQKKRGRQDITLGVGCLHYWTVIHEVKSV